MIRDDDFVIGEDNWESQIDTTVVDGELKARGLIQRDYTRAPVGSYSGVPALADIKVPPRNDWPAIIQQREADKSFLSHIRRKNGPNGGHIPALDQNGNGYCWSYSAHSCVMLWRAVMGLPYKRLSAHAVAAIIKKGADQGGWAALSADFIAKNGCADIDHWKEKSRDIRQDTPEMRQHMLTYKVEGLWRDLQASVYDANLTEDQAFGLMFANIPIQMDFNWWSHSVCGMDPTLNVRPTERKSAKWKAKVKTDFNSLDLRVPKDAAVFADVFGKRGLNSWSDSYGNLGEFVLTGQKSLLNGGCAVGVPVAA